MNENETDASQAEGVIILCGGTVYYRRRNLTCWGLCAEFERKCGRPEPERPCVVAYDASPWYGPRITCTFCGDSWADGEMAERPWQRGWRKEAIKRAAEQYNSAHDGPPPRDEEGYIRMVDR